MSTFTLVSGNYIAANDLYLGANNDTWVDLGSAPIQTWANWTRWNTDPQNLVVRIDDDLSTDNARSPQISLNYVGVLTLTLKTSLTGLFAGEETTYTFTAGTATSVASARYYRWTVTLAPNGTICPELRQAQTAYDETYAIEYYRTVDTTTLGGTVAGRTVTHGLGAVYAVELTSHSATTWVDRAYVLPDSWNETTIAPVASIVSKAPLTIVLRDDFGVEVDGIVDMVIIGAPQVMLTDAGVIRL